MSIPQIPYETPLVNGADANHLKLLVIFSWIWGAIVALFSSIFLIHVFMGLMMIHGNFPASPAQATAAGGAPAPLPPGFGWFFVVFGSAGVLFGWTLGVLNFLSAYSMNKRRWRIFSLVVAALNCLYVPFGTAFGVFMFVVLLRPTVTQAFQGEAA